MHAFLYRPFSSFPIPVPAFGHWVRRRRLEVGLSCARAAAQAGLDRRDWLMLEQGWVPDCAENQLRSIAATLQMTFEALDGAIEPLRAHFERAAA